MQTTIELDYTKCPIKAASFTLTKAEIEDLVDHLRRTPGLYDGSPLHTLQTNLRAALKGGQ